MDYSAALPNESENPEGTSPWATSPGPTRSTFGATPGAGHPSSPLPPQSPYAEIAEQDQHGFAADVEPRSSTEQSTAPARPAENGESQPQSPRAEQRGAQEQRRQEPQRFHGTRGRQNVPQHKLQAKVT